MSHKKILWIGTGGTIASTSTEEGLAPELSSTKILEMIPELRDRYLIDCMQPMNLDSTNVLPCHWLLLADLIRRNYDAYDGFVITHGTDTMAYTAAGLSYLIQNSSKPIVLTGAQRPVAMEGSDAIRNLMDSFLYASSDLSCGIQVVFSGSVILGTRARKNYAKRFMAFESVNYPEIARIQDGSILRYIPQRMEKDVRFYDRLDQNVGLIKLVPGIRNELLRHVIDSSDGVIIESFGVGGLPEYSDLYAQIKRAEGLGKLILMTTQVPNEGSDLSIYHVGKVLKDQFRLLEAHDMTTEAGFAKLMWILGCTKNFTEARELFYRPVYSDILFSSAE